MRSITILSAIMILGMLCLPLAGAEKPGVKNVTVKVSGDANGAVATASDASTTPAAIESERGFVGVHLSPVPAAVASQLRLKGKGVMIRNVFKGSPADKAGLDRYDVIVKIGRDQPVQTVPQFVQAVRKLKPGDVLDLTVLRGGRQKPITVTLDKIPAGQVEYVYEDDPDNQIKDEFSIRRGMLRKKDDKWVFETPDGKPIEFFLPQIPGAVPNKAWGNIRVQVQATGGADKTRQVTITSVNDGKTLCVKSGADDKIEVTRTMPDGKSSKATYDNTDQLKQKDKEAFDLYQSVRDVKVRLGVGKVGRTILRGVGPIVEVGEDAGAAVEEIQAIAEKLQAELEQHVRELTDKTRRKVLAARGKISRTVGPVSRQFDVDDTGRIKVRIQKGGDELSIVFANQDEMKKKSPKLHAEYMRLLDAGKTAQ